MNLSEILEGLKKFNSPICELYPGCSQIEILELERKIENKLPLEFKNFLLISNGAIINCHELFGIRNGKKFEDLFGNYLFEKNEVENSIRDYYLPIYPDGMGNHNCLDLKSLTPDGKYCNVIFWQHDRLYSDDEQPDIDANSFTQFLENLLKEIYEQYNDDGTEKN
jgi:cell wall assembly regulator SMI1